MNHIRGNLIFLMIACSAVIAHAQLVTANLQGVVTDSSGAVIAGASITASDSETGVQRTTTTNADAAGCHRASPTRWRVRPASRPRR